MSFTIKICDVSNRSYIDDNGYLIVKKNPIVKAGVFDYLLSEVKANVSKDDDRIVKVCRTFDDLKSKKELFLAKPIKLNHVWVGKEGDTDVADGVIYGEISENEPYLIADLAIYNQELIKKIKSGEVVELSPAYDTEIVEKDGLYNGEAYSFLQILKNVNHLAVVENGRSGADLRIYDKKNEMEAEMKFTDSLYKALKRLKDEELLEVKDDKKEFIDRIIEIVESEISYDEKFDSIINLVKGLEVSQNDNEVEKTEETLTDDDVENKDDDKIEISKEDLVELVEKITDSKLKKLQDSMLKEAKKVSDAYSEVSETLGTTFDFQNKSVSDIYKFGYEALSGAKLKDGLDSITAFKMAAGLKNQNTKTKIQDSEVKSDFDLSLFK